MPLSVSLYETDDGQTASLDDQTANDPEAFDWSTWSPTTTDNTETIAQFLGSFTANHAPLQGKVRDGLLGKLQGSGMDGIAAGQEETGLDADAGHDDLPQQEERQTLPAPIHLQSATNENNDPLLSGALPAGMAVFRPNVAFLFQNDFRSYGGVDESAGFQGLCCSAGCSE